jgi:hypothetical protein
MRQIREIVVHCSDSGFGDVRMINDWHEQRGFNCIGYHRVILNGFRRPRRYEPDDEGKVEFGRPASQIGAHVRGHNRHSLGICYIGNAENPITDLMYDVLTENLVAWCEEYHLTEENIFGHTELDQRKSCPDLDMEKLRDDVRDRLKEGW